MTSRSISSLFSSKGDLRISSNILGSVLEELGGCIDDQASLSLVDDRHRAINWCSIFPFHDAVILKNFVDNHTYPLDFNVWDDASSSNETFVSRSSTNRNTFTRNRTLSSRSYPSNLHQFTFVETKPSFIPRSLQRRTIECVDSIRLGEKRCITTNRKVGCIEHGMFWPVLVFLVFFPMRTKRSVERNRRWRARADRLVSGISAMTFTTMSMQNKSSVPNGRCVRHRCVQTNTSSLSLSSVRLECRFDSFPRLSYDRGITWFPSFIPSLLHPTSFVDIASTGNDRHSSILCSHQSRSNGPTRWSPSFRIQRTVSDSLERNWHVQSDLHVSSTGRDEKQSLTDPTLVFRIATFPSRDMFIGSGIRGTDLYACFAISLVDSSRTECSNIGEQHVHRHYLSTNVSRGGFSRCLRSSAWLSYSNASVSVYCRTTISADRSTYSSIETREFLPTWPLTNLHLSIVLAKCWTTPSHSNRRH